jgi:hypothetical protein
VIGWVKVAPGVVTQSPLNQRPLTLQPKLANSTVSELSVVIVEASPTWSPNSLTEFASKPRPGMRRHWSTPSGMAE